MTITTIIKLNEYSLNLAEWMTVDELGRQIAAPESGDLMNLPSKHKLNPIIVLLPATEVSTSFLNLPIKSINKIRTAIPFALEEDLACDINLLHFSFKKIKHKNSIPVCVIDKKKFNEYRKLLINSGINAQIITSEIFGLPMIQRTVNVLIEPNKTLINNGLNKAYALEHDSVIDLHKLIDEVKEETNHVQVYLDYSCQDKYKNIQENQDGIDIQLLEGNSLQKLSQIVINSDYVNLLQGEYAAQIDYKKYLQPWRYSAYLLLGLVIILMTSKTINYFQATNYEATLSSRFLDEYKKFQPNANNISDPIRIVTAIKNNNSVKINTSFFLSSLQELSKAVSDNDDVFLTSITYQENVTILRLTASNVTVIDTIRKAIIQNGIFQAKILATNQINNNVQSRIEIKAL
ncbi:type II secretion system protein GspL [Woeseiaceae bacterium]|jgi:general secretion pathway protein L|nr:type II secretion system protein GspL [Woeseiaceae bacterium]